jgi:hypothetical protein
VSFSCDATETYAVTIEFDTGNPDIPRSINHHIVTKQKSTSVVATIQSDPRRTVSTPG